VIYIYIYIYLGYKASNAVEFANCIEQALRMSTSDKQIMVQAAIEGCYRFTDEEFSIKFINTIKQAFIKLHTYNCNTQKWVYRWYYYIINIITSIIYIYICIRMINSIVLYCI
jgi:hypothetical protein